MATTSGSSQQSATSSPTAVSVLDDPRLAQLFSNAQGAIPTNLSSIFDLVGQGSNSPLMQEIIQRGLGSLQPGAAQSRQAMTDAFRASGGLRGTAYGQGMALNEGEILGKQSSLIGDLLSKTLSTLVGGELQQQQNQFLAPKTMIDLLQAGRPGIGQQTSSQGTTNYGGSGDPATDYMNDWLAQYRSSGNPFGAGGSGGQQANTGGGWLGVNYKPTPMPVAQPYYDPRMYNPMGTVPQGGAPQSNPYGPSAAPYTPPAPEYGPWQKATPNQPGTGTWAGYQPQSFNPSGNYNAQGNIFGNFPAPNPYAGSDWEY